MYEMPQPTNYALSRADAKMIAEEVRHSIMKDFQNILNDLLKSQSEECISLKDAARMIGVAPSTLYKTKDKYGCYSKINQKIFFFKKKLLQVLESGAIQTK